MTTDGKHMDKRDIDKMERRLAEALKKERHEAIGYALLAVMLTPAFAVVAWFIVIGMAGLVHRGLNTASLSLVAFYTALNVLLANMAAFVFFYSGRSSGQVRLERKWIIGVLVFLLLLVVTYGTPILEYRPVLFALGYIGGGLLFLALMGQVYIDHRAADPAFGDEGGLLSPLLAVCGFIGSVYAELVRSARLWPAPKDEAVHLGAWVLCKFAFEMSGPSAQAPTYRRVVDVLRRLELLQDTADRLELTPKGLDFVGLAGQTGK